MNTDKGFNTRIKWFTKEQIEMMKKIVKATEPVRKKSYDARGKEAVS